MRVGVRTDIGKVRRSNQDNYCVTRRLFAVADGMGGSRAGEVASALAVESLESHVFDDSSPERSLLEAINEANRRIYELAAQRPEYAGMGTTLTAAFFADDTVFIGHVGDSRAYLVTNGSITQVTNDHSIVGELFRAGSLTEEEAMNHPQRNLLIQALGTDERVSAEVHRARVSIDDAFVLCTDGLSSLVSSEEIRDTLMVNDDPQKAADDLTEMALERGGHDNITVVVIYALPGAPALEPAVEDAIPLEESVSFESRLCGAAVD